MPAALCNAGQSLPPSTWLPAAAQLLSQTAAGVRRAKRKGTRYKTVAAAATRSTRNRASLLPQQSLPSTPAAGTTAIHLPKLSSRKKELFKLLYLHK